MHDLAHEPATRVLLQQGADRADRPPAGRLAAGDPQGAGRQRGRRRRGSRDPAGGHGHRRPHRDHGRGQRPGHPGRCGRGHPRLQRAGLVARSIRQPDPWRAGQRAQDHPRHAVRAWTANAAGSRSRRGASCHTIDFRVDRIRQRPIVEHHVEAATSATGTRITVRVAGFSLLNPRKREGSVFTNRRPVRLAEPAPVDGGRLVRRALDRGGDRPGMVQVEALGPDLAALVHRRRISSAWSPAYIAHDTDRGRIRTVRELVTEFRGLSGTAKQKKVLDATGLARAPLTALVNGNDLDRRRDRPPARGDEGQLEAGQAAAPGQHRARVISRRASRPPAARRRASTTGGSWTPGRRALGGRDGLRLVPGR